MARFLALALLMPAPSPGWSTLRRGDEEIEVYRDRWGIPHVFAKSLEGAFWAEGYTESEDRLWQMEMFRRGARGETAEVLGAKGIDADLQRRRAGYTEDELKTMLASTSERTRRILSAYVEGVNAFVREGRLPPEFGEHKLTPRPWTETDSLAIGIMMARRFGDSGGVELVIQAVHTQLRGKYGAEKARQILRDLLRDRDPLAPTTLNDHDRSVRRKGSKDDKHNFLPLNLEGFAAVERERRAAQAAIEELGLPAYGGSNAWVVGPKKSASGRPMLYAGPMMGFNAPPLCNEIHLSGPGLDVAGMSFPGVPGVMIGFNDRIAWTTTSGGADLVDVYVLELDPENPERYRWGDGWRPFETFTTEIKVAGAEPRRETIRRSRYGPLVGTPDLDTHRAYTQAMSFWLKEQSSLEAVLEFNFAGSVEEFGRAVAKVSTSHNFFAVDREGHIGFWYAGAHPKRRAGHDPRFPQRGDGSMDWEGVLAPEEWPKAIDPPAGYFANWNNKPARAWEPTGLGKLYWGKRIGDVLEGREKMTFEQMEALAREAAYYDYLADYFLPYLMASASGSADPNVARAFTMLSRWDRLKRPGEPGPVIVDRWARGMMRRIFGDELGLALTQREVERLVASPLLYLLEDNGVLTYDFAGGADLRALGHEVLKEIVKDGVDALRWEEDSVNFKGRVGRIASEKGRGTFQMTVEMTPDGPRATTLSAPGQSADPESAHHRDQLELFTAWRYKAFLFRRAEME